MKRFVDLNDESKEEEITALPEDTPIYGRGSVEIRDVSKLERTAVFVFNTADVDEYDSVISPRGLDVESYFRKTGGAVRRGHSSNSEIGKSLWEKMNPDKTQWLSRVKFADTERGQETMILAIEEDIIKFASVGLNRKGIVELFGNKAKIAYEEDYKDVGLRATPKMNWYIRSSVMQHYGVLSDPGNVNTKLLRSVSGMSEDTQMWLFGAFMKEQFPSIMARLENIERGQESINGLDVKLQGALDKITEIEKTKTEEHRDGAKPLVPEKIIKITRDEYAKFLEYKVKRGIQRQIDFKKGKVNHGR